MAGKQIYLAAHSLRLSGEKISSRVRGYVEQLRKNNRGYGVGKRYRNKKTSSYICSLQNPDGGFRRKKENRWRHFEFSYYAVASLRCLGEFCHEKTLQPL